ncbi:invasion associated locus B family protein [Celeribacter litoreus]|uniref:invasion associated locus B family protein n=1 Tax=Celeribacter litoreus TaxID=2876714 RepID=UPI001CCAE481|nr:invasion associated locus B family protein [Celeribacter litoreus]MCA0043865.1 invasion associated locus B family protein [Celeribacter litoreus]
MMTSVSHKFSTFVSAALIALGTAAPVVAQDEELSTGVPVEANENVGRTYLLETQGDWEIHCIKAPEGQPDPCSMYQLLKDASGAEIAEVTLFHLGQENAEAAMTIITPLETNLTKMLSFYVDEENGRRYPFQFCTQGGCFVRAALPAEEIDLLKKGNNGQISISQVSSQNPVNLTMSLTGFTAGYTRVTALNEAAKNGQGPDTVTQ